MKAKKFGRFFTVIFCIVILSSAVFGAAVCRAAETAPTQAVSESASEGNLTEAEARIQALLSKGYEYGVYLFSEPHPPYTPLPYNEDYQALQTLPDAASALLAKINAMVETPAEQQTQGWELRIRMLLFILSQEPFCNQMSAAELAQYEQLQDSELLEPNEISYGEYFTIKPGSTKVAELRCNYDTYDLYRHDDDYTTTTGGLRVDLLSVNRELVDLDYMQMNGLYETILDVRQVAEPTTRYTCHSYAWYWQSPSLTFSILDSGAQTYLNDLHKTTRANGTAAVGDIVVYYDKEGHLTHSAVITEISGGELICTSKWGPTGLYRHDINTVPENYYAGYSHPASGYKIYRYYRSHVYNTISSYNASTHTFTCNYCGKTLAESHTTRVTGYTASGHTRACTACSYKVTEAHILNKVTGKCRICGYQGPTVAPMQLPNPL